MSYRARAALRRRLRSPGAVARSKFPFRPRLEELEARTLLSASATAAVDQPPLPSSLVAQPDLDVRPMAGNGASYYFTPQQIRRAYGDTMAVLPNGQPATGAGQTIAIVDAYHDPNIAGDLAGFDSTFGLAAPPWFGVWRMNGVSTVDTNWSYETALDVEWAHAIAPGANILLVEASSNSYSDLLSAVRFAASAQEVVAVSMSWGGPEFAGESGWDSTFTTPAGHLGGWDLPGGVSFVASSGDSGAGAQWPATSPNVLAVGGTSLVLTPSGSYWGESGWSGSGGGISHVEFEPAYQWGVQHSGARTSPDVAYDANPNSGVLVYNTLGLPAGYSGWWIVGGTSAGAPQWAAILAMADQARAVNHLPSLANAVQAVYSLSRTDFHDITTGSNGYPTAPGYDLVTGLGSPLANRIATDLAGFGSSPTYAPATARFAPQARATVLQTGPEATHPAEGTSPGTPTAGQQQQPISADAARTGSATPSPVATHVLMEVGAGGLAALLEVPATSTGVVPVWSGDRGVAPSAPPTMWSSVLGVIHPGAPIGFNTELAGSAATPAENVVSDEMARSFLLPPDPTPADDAGDTVQPGDGDLTAADTLTDDD
jgi:hypothetical protein